MPAGLLLLSQVTGAAMAAVRDGVVRVEGTHCVLDGKPYRFAGASFRYGAYPGAERGVGDCDRLRAGLDRLRDAGIDNLRVLAMAPPPDRSGGRYAG